MNSTHTNEAAPYITKKFTMLLQGLSSPEIAVNTSIQPDPGNIIQLQLSSSSIEIKIELNNGNGSPS